MATAEPSSIPGRRRGWRRALPWLLVIAAALLAWMWEPLSERAAASTSYAARTACSCRYVAGRALSDCEEFARSKFAWMSEDAEANSVTAWLPLLSTQTATFREGSGCVLQPWRD